jgi:predicted alpha/beta superfamily hydrolase
MEQGMKSFFLAGLACLSLLGAACSKTSPESAPPAAAQAPSGTQAVTDTAHVAASTSAPPPYVLDDTEVRTLHADGTNRDYQVQVSLPPSYRKDPDRRYPVLFVTDANYAFPLIRSISRRVGDHGNGTEDFILVGLAYAVGDTPEYSRRRDYTPTPHGSADAVSDMPGRPVVYGESDTYRRFIKEQVFPLIAANYRADMTRKIYAGHSYGGLLGLDILIAEPDMFQYYILGSPSLQFDRQVEFARMRTATSTLKDMPANVMMVLGAYETVEPSSHDPRYNRSVDMVRNARRFMDELKAKRYPGLHIQMTTIPDEDHLTVFPSVITRGLLWALPGKQGQRS